MKNISLLFMMSGIVFSSLGSKIYVEVEKKEKEKEIIVESVNSINKMFHDISIIKERNSIENDCNKKIEKLQSSLKRSEYNTLVTEVKKIQYEDIKEEVLTKLDSVEKKITENEKKQREIEEKKKREAEAKRQREIEAKKKKEAAKKKSVLATSSQGVKVSAYTAFCSDGCRGYTASGLYIGNSIYYNDKEYGKVRIVAGDKSLPFGTIVRFNNLQYFGKTIYAIVLDRGGAIGNGKRVLFDLLFSTEKEANNFGIAKNVSYDILRKGY